MKNKLNILAKIVSKFTLILNDVGARSFKMTFLLRVSHTTILVQNQLLIKEHLEASKEEWINFQNY